MGLFEIFKWRAKKEWGFEDSVAQQIIDARSKNVVSTLAPDQRKDIEDNIKSFDAKPNLKDVSFESWILRLSLYGKIIYHYRNTEEQFEDEVNFNKFMDVMDYCLDNKTLGEWEVNREAFNIVKFYKQFSGKDGQIYEEEFNVMVKVRPDMVKLMQEAFNKAEINRQEEINQEG